jgi:glycosyltransferase involved in cell wall biosynthesis
MDAGGAADFLGLTPRPNCPRLIQWSPHSFFNLIPECVVSQHPPVRLVVLMPVRDDWLSAAELIRRLDKSISSDACTMEIILVDDDSAQKCDRNDFQCDFTIVRAIRTLRLRRNLGHQRAIAIGLVHIHQTTSCDAVVVMDADGEDTPEGVARLLHVYSSLDDATAIFAERSRRSESLIFRSFYHFYKMLHRSLTGISVRVGNFSILPAKYLNTLVVLSELWNHYAAAIFRSKLPFIMIPIPRGTRIAGNSKMNFVALVTHGLSAISVFGDIVGVRLLISSLAGALLVGFGIILVVMIRLFTNRAIPGWATYATGSLAIMLFQLITIATSFTFFVLSSRTNLGFVPLRDYSLFVEEVVEIYVKGNQKNCCT